MMKDFFNIAEKLITYLILYFVLRYNCIQSFNVNDNSIIGIIVAFLCSIAALWITNKLSNK